MKLSYIKLPNEILEINLTANELAVLFYLSSIYSGKDTVRVKQSTIAQKCGFKTTQTVSRITTSLSAKGLITQRRCVYDDNSTGIIFYTLNLPCSVSGYFPVDRHILSEGLTPTQLKVYLHICRALLPAGGKCWNSYNDLARMTGICRSKVIVIISQLIGHNVIRKQRIKTRENRRVYGDNHYMLVRYAAHRPIRRKPHKKIGLPRQSSPVFQSVLLSVSKNTFSAYNNITSVAHCQVLQCGKQPIIFLQRGSPQNRRSIY